MSLIIYDGPLLVVGNTHAGLRRAALPEQEDLEVANGVSAGKYTIGLGQEAMAFTG